MRGGNDSFRVFFAAESGNTLRRELCARGVTLQAGTAGTIGAVAESYAMKGRGSPIGRRLGRRRETAMPKCLSCGYLLESGETTCPVCGASAAQTLGAKEKAAEPEARPVAPPRQTRMIAAGAFAVIAVGLAIFLSVRALAPKRPSYLTRNTRAAPSTSRVTPQAPAPEQYPPQQVPAAASQMQPGAYVQPPMAPPPPVPQPAYTEPAPEETAPEPEAAQPTEPVDPNTTTVQGWVAYPKGGNAPTVVTAPSPESTPSPGGAAPTPAAGGPPSTAPAPRPDQEYEPGPDSSGGE
jgi:hypothetical protein